MKERMSGIGGNGNDFEGNPDDGSGAAELDVPKRCVGCPYAKFVEGKLNATVKLQRRRETTTRDCAGIFLENFKHTDESLREIGSIVDKTSADAEAIIEEAAKAAQREIDKVTANCHGPVTATVESRSSEGTVVEFVGCDSPTLDGGKRTGEYVSSDRYNPDLALEQALQAISALRRSLLPDNGDNSAEGEYAAPPHWINEIRGASDDES